LGYWIEETLLNCRNDVKIVVVGNKTDIAESEGVREGTVDQKTLEEIQNAGYEHVKISCKTGSEVDQFWALLNEEVRKKMFEKTKTVPELVK
jgi:50S ribosomal subunit-associated GTPase HflX